MDTIVEAVAKAIETALVSGSASVGDERLREIARAAIEAYEAAKREKAGYEEASVMGDDGNQYLVRWPKGYEVSIIGVDAVRWGGEP